MQIDVLIVPRISQVRTNDNLEQFLQNFKTKRNDNILYRTEKLPFVVIVVVLFIKNKGCGLEECSENIQNKLTKPQSSFFFFSLSIPI